MTELSEDEHEDSLSAGDWDAFARLLMRIKSAKRLSYETISRRSGKSKFGISKSTAENLCKRATRPSEHSVRGFLFGCGMTATETDAVRAIYESLTDQLRPKPNEEDVSQPSAWYFAGLDAENHFSRRARGQRNIVRSGDLFQGRTLALRAINGWVMAGLSPGLPFVITGQPGAGKSAVIARAALDLKSRGIGPGLAFHARGATLLDAIRAVSGLLHVAPPPSSIDAVLASAIENTSSSIFIVIVDALDEVRSDGDREAIVTLLCELAALPRFRIVVATRSLLSRDRFRYGSLLHGLGVENEDSESFVDLDTERYFEDTAIRRFAYALLTQEGALHPGPLGKAWTWYRQNETACRTLAAAVAVRAGRNFLVAALASVPLSISDTPIDPASEKFDPTDIPSSVGEALAKYLDGLASEQRTKIRGLLTALAYARGEGLDDETWLAFSSALGYAAEASSVDELRVGASADYLLEKIASRTGIVTRLFHQALVDELQRGRYQITDEQRILAKLRPDDGWRSAGEYALEHAAEHAAAAHQLAETIQDRDFFTSVNPIRLTNVLVGAKEIAIRSYGALLVACAHRIGSIAVEQRASLLLLTAAHLGWNPESIRFLASADEQFIPVWAHALGSPHLLLAGHGDAISALLIGERHDRGLIYAATNDQTLRAWDILTGQLAIEPVYAQTGTVVAIAQGAIGNTDALLTGDDAGVLTVRSASNLKEIKACQTGAAITAISYAQIGDRDVAIVGGSSGTIEYWDLGANPIRRLTSNAGTTPVIHLQVILLGGRQLLCILRAGKRPWIWELSIKYPAPVQVFGPRACQALAYVNTAGNVVVACTTERGSLEVWNLGRKSARMDVRRRLTANSRPIALGTVDNRIVLISTDENANVLVEDARSGQTVNVLSGHSDEVATLALGKIGQVPVLVSGGSDRTVRVWSSLDDERDQGKRLPGCRSAVKSLTSARAGQDSCVAGCDDGGALYLWDGDTGVQMQLEIEEFVKDEPCVNALRFHQVNDSTYLAVGIRAQVLSIPIMRDSAAQFDDVLRSDWEQSDVTAIAVPSLGPHSVMAIGFADGSCSIVDPADNHKQIRKLHANHQGEVTSVAITRIGNRQKYIVACGYSSGAITVHDVRTGETVSDEAAAHQGAVRSLAAIGRPHLTIFSGGEDGVCRSWAYGRRSWSDRIQKSESIRTRTLASHQGSINAIDLFYKARDPLVVSVGDDATMCLTSTSTTRPTTKVNLLARGGALSVEPDSSRIYVGADKALLAMDYSSFLEV